MFRSESVPSFSFNGDLPGAQALFAGRVSRKGNAIATACSSDEEQRADNLGRRSESDGEDCTNATQPRTTNLFKELASITTAIPSLIQAMQLSKGKSTYSHDFQMTRAAHEDDAFSQISQLSDRLAEVECLLHDLRQDIESGMVVQHAIPTTSFATAVETLQQDMKMLHSILERQPSMLQLQADLEKVLRMSDDGASAMLNQQVEISEVRGQISELIKTTATLQRAVREQEREKQQRGKQQQAESSVATVNEIQLQMTALVEEHETDRQQMHATQQRYADQLNELSKKVADMEVMITDRVGALESKLVGKASDINGTSHEAPPSHSAGYCDEQVGQRLEQLDANLLILAQQHEKMYSEIKEVQVQFQKFDAPSLMRSFGELLVVGQDSCATFFASALKSYSNKDEPRSPVDMKQWVLHQTDALAQCLDRQLKTEQRLDSAERQIQVIPPLNIKSHQLERHASHSLFTSTAHSSQTASPTRTRSSPTYCHEQDPTEYNDRSSFQHPPYSYDTHRRSRAVSVDKVCAMHDIEDSLIKAARHPHSSIISRPHDKPLIIRSASAEGLHRASQQSAVNSSTLSPIFGQHMFQTSGPVEAPLCSPRRHLVQRIPRIQPVARTLVSHVRLQHGIADSGGAVAKAVPAAFPGAN